MANVITPAERARMANRAFFRYPVPEAYAHEQQLFNSGWEGQKTKMPPEIDTA